MKLLDLLRESHCSVNQLSTALGVNRQTVYTWDKLRATPKPQTILKIKEVLGVSAEEVLKCFIE